MLRTGFLLLQLASQLVEAESERQKVLSAAFSLLDDQVQNFGRHLFPDTHLVRCPCERVKGLIRSEVEANDLNT